MNFPNRRACNIHNHKYSWDRTCIVCRESSAYNQCHDDFMKVLNPTPSPSEEAGKDVYKCGYCNGAGIIHFGEPRSTPPPMAGGDWKQEVFKIAHKALDIDGLVANEELLKNFPMTIAEITQARDEIVEAITSLLSEKEGEVTRDELEMEYIKHMDNPRATNNFLDEGGLNAIVAYVNSRTKRNNG